MESDFELRKQDADHHMTAHRGFTAVHHDVSRDNKASANKLLESNVDTDAKKEVKIISVHSQCILALTLRCTLTCISSSSLPEYVQGKTFSPSLFLIFCVGSLKKHSTVCFFKFILKLNK